ncbi:MAG: OmpH family outer membrane protein [Chitinophagales bacterium]|nr:OmpH family outer membrane protein [Chitinophagales bacterium]
MKNKIITNSLVLAFSLLAVFISFWNVLRENESPKIAVVKSAIVVDKYKGMIAISNYISKKEITITKKIQEEISRLDSLKTKGILNNDNYQDQIRRLEERAKNDQEELLQNSEKMTQGGLDQINHFIKKYAETNDYDLIIGATALGNILYGSDVIDITDELIQAMNESYDE